MIKIDTKIERWKKRNNASWNWVLQGQEKVLQGQEDLILQRLKSYNKKYLKKNEDSS
jgi:hypothetical protein